MKPCRVTTGFTLLEVLIVLAIVSILVSIAYPTYAGYIVRTRRTEGQVALIEAMQKQERYRAQHNRYVAFSAGASAEGDGDDAGGFAWWSGHDAASSAYELDARACPDMAIDDCVELRARPGTERVDRRFRDPECGALTLDSLGRQGAQGVRADGASCWP
ncbi:type IV pilin protein [uncultured Massilia sp.]|uniref:type IV pilin protein n=1 Tax=uncultured Massilia sp. TaxID=169973 RepID=UPI0025E8838F|nr:type IV pilin protein [uncultured Massilia sp.]